MVVKVIVIWFRCYLDCLNCNVYLLKCDLKCDNFGKSCGFFENLYCWLIDIFKVI